MSFSIDGDRLLKYEGDAAEATVPDEICVIGPKAFCGHPHLKKVTLPSSVYSIGEEAFAFCTELEIVEIRKSDQDDAVVGQKTQSVHPGLGEQAFVGCRKLEIFFVPAEIQFMDHLSYAGCENLKEILFSDTVEEIGNKAFYMCRNLKWITGPEKSLEADGERILPCKNLTYNSWREVPLPLEAYELEIDNSDLEAGFIIRGNILIEYQGDKKEIIEVPEGIEVIGRSAFKGEMSHGRPVRIILPDSVKTIHDGSITEGYVYDNMPPGYLRQSRSLPAKETCRLMTGCWQDQVTPEDWVYRYLYQKKGGWEAHLGQTSETLSTMCDILEAHGGSWAFLRATEYSLQHRADIPEDDRLRLYRLAVKAKAKKAVEILEPFYGIERNLNEEFFDGRDWVPVTHPIETFCSQRYSPYMLDNYLRQRKIPQKFFEGAKYHDTGHPAHPFVVKCALVPYMQQFNDTLLSEGSRHKEFLEFRLDPTADRIAKSLDPTSLHLLLEPWVDEPILNRHALIPYGRFASAEQLKDLERKKDKWLQGYTVYEETSYDFGESGVIERVYGRREASKVIRIIDSAVLLNESEEAKGMAYRLGLTDHMAKIHGIPLEELIRNSLVDIALDDSGRVIYDLDDMIVEARFGKDLKLTLYDKAKGIRIDELPKEGVDSGKAEKARHEISLLVEKISSTLMTRFRELKDQTLTGTGLDAPIWESSYMHHIVPRQLAQQVVWEQEQGGQRSNFLPTDRGHIRSDGSPFTLLQEGQVKAADPIKMGKAERVAWRNHFLTHHLQEFTFRTKQAFDSKGSNTRLTPDRQLAGMCELLKEYGRPYHHYMLAVEYYLAHAVDISNVTLERLYRQLAEAKLTKAIELLEPYYKFHKASSDEFFDGESWARVTHPIESFCFERFSPQLLDKYLRKKRIDPKLFEGVRYLKTGEAVPAFIVKCALVPYMEQYDHATEDNKSAWTVPFLFSLDPASDKIAATFEPETLQTFFDQFPPYMQLTNFIVAYGRYASEKQIMQLYRRIAEYDGDSTYRKSNSLEDWYIEERAISWGAFILNDSWAAVLVADLNDMLASMAEIRGMSESEYRNSRTLNFGFNQVGEIHYQRGDQELVAAFGDNSELLLKDQRSGQTVICPPIDGSDDGEEDSVYKDYLILKQNVRFAIRHWSSLLKKQMVNDETIELEDWQSTFMKDPLLKTLGRRLVWEQSDDGKSLCFTVTDQGLVKADGSPIQLLKGTEIGLAHPSEMTREELHGWRQYFIDNDLKQPLKQLWARHLTIDSRTLKELMRGLQLDVTTAKKLPAHGFKFEIGRWTDENNFHISYGHYPPYFEARSHIGGIKNWGRIGHWDYWEDNYYIYPLRIKLHYPVCSRKLNRILLAFISYFPVVQAIYEKNESYINLLLGVLGNDYLDRLLALATDDNKPELVAAILEEKNRRGMEQRGWKEFSLDP